MIIPKSVNQPFRPRSAPWVKMSPIITAAISHKEIFFISILKKGRVPKRIRIKVDAPALLPRSNKKKLAPIYETKLSNMNRINLIFLRSARMTERVEEKEQKIRKNLVRHIDSCVTGVFVRSV
jgi:hypothetical protein